MMSAPVLRYGALDRAHLTKHVLSLAQRVGVDGVTMRLLAAEAGTSASSVYYHVKDKNELLDLLIEAVVESIETPSAAEDRRQRLITLYSRAWRVLIGVPGIAGLLQQRPHSPAADDMDRATREILADCGVPAKELPAAHALLYIHLLGSVELEHRRRPGEVNHARAKEFFLYGLRVILEGLLRPPSASKSRRGDSA
jgi:AcrR family transcriptional regulator